MSKFNTKRVGRRTVNLAGGDAFSVSAKEELVSAVLNTFLEDKYYESGNKRAGRIGDLVSRTDPQFVAKLAVVARNEFNLRSVTTVLLGELAKNHRGDDLVKRAIVAATPRVDDLTELVSYVGLPLPKQVKRGIRNSILKFNRYQLAKYKGAGKAVSLVDLFNLVHPKAQHATEDQKKAWKDLMEGTLVSKDTWESTISKVGEEDLDEAEMAEAKSKAWSDLVLEGKMGYMALLRNLNNLLKNDVSPKVIKAAADKLSNREEVKKSRQLPFRFITAYKNVRGSRVLSDAIALAIEHALDNVPELPGRTLVAVDTSGSMSGDPIEKAAIFAAALARSNDADLILYDTRVAELPLNSRTPVIDLAMGIEKNALGGGTATGEVFQWATVNGNYDRIIILSDNESWSGNAQSEYLRYRNTTKTDPYIYAIDIAGYGTTDLAGGRVTHISGWSEKLLDFIGIKEKGDSMVNYIENYEF